MKICHICHGNGYLRTKYPYDTNINRKSVNDSSEIKQCYRCKSSGEVDELETGRN